MPLISEIKVDKEQLFSNFKHISNIANFKMISCIKLLFNKNNIFKNSANYFMLFLFILSIISIFVFAYYDKKKITSVIHLFKKGQNSKKENIQKQNQINKIDKQKKIIEVEKKKDKNQKTKKKDNNNTKKKSILTLKQNMNKKDKKNNKIKSIKLDSNEKDKNDIIINKDSKRYFFSNKKHNKNNSIINEENVNNDFKINLSKNKKENIKIKNKNELNNDLELNSLNYVEALKLDKRKYCEYYLSLLRTKHILIFTFFQYKDYNSNTIKIYLFFFTFTINYVVSAMFYSDSTMHKIYVDDGYFDFTYQLPQMIYSFLISSILKSLLNILGTYESNILSIKKEIISDEKMRKELFKIKLKIILFFVITYTLLFFFWIYLGCFCAVYKNTQLHLFYDVISSFGISFIIPMFIYLLPGIFRIPSLKDKKGNRYLLFSFSKLLQYL